MTDKNNKLMNDFENSFRKALKSLGYLFPVSEDEVDTFEKNNKIEKVPEHYLDASELLKKSKTFSIKKKKNTEINDSAENLARAARKGENIPEEILKKMKSDRDKIENDKE